MKKLLKKIDHFFEGVELIWSILVFMGGGTFTAGVVYSLLSSVPLLANLTATIAFLIGGLFFLFVYLLVRLGFLGPSFWE